MARCYKCGKAENAMRVICSECAAENADKDMEIKRAMDIFRLSIQAHSLKSQGEQMERLTARGMRGVCDMASTELCLAQSDCYKCSYGSSVFKRLWDIESIIFNTDDTPRLTLEELKELIRLYTEGGRRPHEV